MSESFGTWINNYLCNQCISPLKCSFESHSKQHYVIWFVSDDLSVVFVGSHFVVSHLKTIQTYSLGTPALQKAAKNDSNFKYENRCSEKETEKRYENRCAGKKPSVNGANVQ